MKRITTANDNVETKDIMYTLLMALPAAVDSLLYVPAIEQIFITSDVPGNAARFLRENVIYREDGLTHQTIQLPNALFSSSFGDCKSFSLFIAAVLTKAGIKNGFRFASYQPGEFTHVYNFYVDNSNKIVYLDTCMSNLKESNKAIKVENMEVSIIGRTPIAHKATTKINNVGNHSIGNIVSTIYLMLPRAAFLALLKLNYRGYADVLYSAKNSTNPTELAIYLQMTSLWLSSGGDINKLNIAIDQGRGKNPLLGRGTAADELYLNQQWEQLKQELSVAEFVGTAIEQGYVLDPFFTSNTPGPTFGNPTVDWQLIFPGASNPPSNWPAILVSLFQSIQQFFVDQGNAILTAEQGGPAVDITTLPTRPLIVPGTGPGRERPRIGTGVESAVAFMAAAAPILVLVSQILKQFGLDEEAGTIEDVANTLIPGSNGGNGGNGGNFGNGENGFSQFLTLPNIFIFGGLAYLLFKRK
jgi:hypothetical protein